MPLANFEVDEKINLQYLSKISKYYSKRAIDIVAPQILGDGLGVFLYYYPHEPYRIGYRSRSKHISFGSIREEALNDSRQPFDPVESVRNYINIVGDIISLGFLPLTRESHGIGQCIAHQNVTYKGAIADMGSLVSISDLKDEREFIQLFYSMIVIMNDTVRKFLIQENSMMPFEFDEPTPISVIISSIFFQGLESELIKIQRELLPAQCHSF